MCLVLQNKTKNQNKTKITETKQTKQNKKVSGSTKENKQTNKVSVLQRIQQTAEAPTLGKEFFLLLSWGTRGKPWCCSPSPCRWHRAEPLLLWDPWAHTHHDPRDRAQPGALPRLPRHLWDPLLQRPLHGNRALLRDWGPVQRHQPCPQAQAVWGPRAWQWHLWIPRVPEHALQQLHELRRYWALLGLWLGRNKEL